MAKTDPWYAWPYLAARRRARYPDDWAERYQSYKDGTNPDLQRWRALGERSMHVAERRP